MPDVHVPKLVEHSGKSVWHIALEVALIGAGVFLRLTGGQWLELSKLYNVQNFVAELNRGFIQAMYVSKNETTFYGAVLLNYGDMPVYEHRLLTMYDEALGKIDKALPEKPANATSSK